MTRKTSIQHYQILWCDMVSWEPMGEGNLELNNLEICYMHANDRLVAKGLQTYTMIDIGRNSADFFPWRQNLWTFKLAVSACILSVSLSPTHYDIFSIKVLVAWLSLSQVSLCFLALPSPIYREGRWGMGEWISVLQDASVWTAGVTDREAPPHL